MRIVLRLVGCLTTLLTVSVGVTHWLASQQPQPATIFFTDSDGSPCKHPCLFGVQPGLTTFEDAAALLRKHPFTRSFEPNLEGDIFGQGSTRIIIGWGLSDNRVSSIELVTTGYQGWGSLGQLMAVLGPPEHVLLDEDHTRAYYRGNQLELVHTHRQTGYVNPDDELESILIQAAPNRAPSPAAAWQGFGSIVRYPVLTPNRFWLYK